MTGDQAAAAGEPRYPVWARRSVACRLLVFLGGLTLAKISILMAGLTFPEDAPSPPVDRSGAVFESESLPDPLPAPAAGPDQNGDGPSADAGMSADGGGVTAAAAPVLPVLEGLDEVEAAILSDLRTRRLELDARKRDLDLRAAVIEATEGRLAEQRAELMRLKEAIEARFVQLTAEEDARITSLVDIYERMKPKAAAEIFDQLQMEVLLQVVGRMAEGKASDIIARMSAAKARLLTTELARRERVMVEPTREGS